MFLFRNVRVKDIAYIIRTVCLSPGLLVGRDCLARSIPRATCHPGYIIQLMAQTANVLVNTSITKIWRAN